MTRDPLVRAVLALLLIALFAAAALPQVPPEVVERVYARGLFPAIGQGISAITGRVGFSVTEPGAALVAAGLVVGLVRGWRRARFWIGLVGLGALAWILFQAVWGVNYRRAPIGQAFGLVVSPSSVAEVRGLAAELAYRVGAEAPPQLDVADVPDLLAAGPGIYTRAATTRRFLAGRYAPPKPLLGSEILSWLGLLGFYNPYTAEPNLNVRAPPFVIPFVVLHEMAHQRGVASEDEASFVGYLLGRDSGDPRFRYSALWEGVVHVGAALRVADPEGHRAWWAALSPRVRADVATYTAWREAHASPLEGLARVVNDTYLRSQGVPDGVQSYGRVTDLMLAEWKARQP